MASNRSASSPVSTWSLDFQTAMALQRFEDAERAALLGMFIADWAMIRGVAGWRRLDHDSCFAVAECALRKLRSYIDRAIAKTGAPPVIGSPAAFLRWCTRKCVGYLPPPPRVVEVPDEATAGAPDPALLAALVLCLETLTPAHREILELFCRPGTTTEAAAVRLKLSPAGVNTRRYNARGALEACLERKGFNVEGGDDA